MPDSRDAVLIEILHDAARQVGTGPGRKQAWIREVWDQILRNGKGGDLSYEEFKYELERLYRAQEISLSGRPTIKGLQSHDADDSELEVDGRQLFLINIPVTQQVSAPRGGDAAFAAQVLATAREVGPGFGDRKVFIGDIWAAAPAAIRALGEGEFKRRLVEAHRDQRVILTRADYVAAMDPAKVAASETVTDGATFHFVTIQPVRNPARRQGKRKSLPLVRNPPTWVTAMIAGSYETLEDTVKAEWLPRLSNIENLGTAGIAADTKEYGCGAYGCVFPTLDPAVVLKVTHDDTEAEFAARLAPTLVAPICVKYHLALRLDAKHKGHGVYLLWRDSASWVGDLDAYLDEDTDGPESGDEFMRLVNLQHDAANAAMLALHGKRPRNVYKPLLNRWVQTLKEMATQDLVPQLSVLAAGMLEVYLEQHIAILDVHSGNIGMVGDQWLITDPGHVVVVNQ